MKTSNAHNSYIHSIAVKADRKNGSLTCGAISGANANIVAGVVDVLRGRIIKISRKWHTMFATACLRGCFT